MSLPAGLTLAPDGTLSWPSPIAGTYAIPVTVTDASGRSAQATLTLVVAPPLTIVVTGVPTAVEGQSFTFKLQATGGDGPPLTWAVTSP